MYWIRFGSKFCRISKFPELILTSNLKPVSISELSSQFKKTWFPILSILIKLEGAMGIEFPLLSELVEQEETVVILKWV